MKYKVIHRIQVWRRERAESRWLEPGTIIDLYPDAPNQNAKLIITGRDNGSWETTKEDLLTSITPI